MSRARDLDRRRLRESAATLIERAREADDVLDAHDYWIGAVRAYERAGLDRAWFDDTAPVRFAAAPAGLHLAELDRGTQVALLADRDGDPKRGIRCRRSALVAVSR